MPSITSRDTKELEKVEEVRRKSQISGVELPEVSVDKQLRR